MPTSTTCVMGRLEKRQHHTTHLRARQHIPVEGGELVPVQRHDAQGCRFEVGRSLAGAACVLWAARVGRRESSGLYRSPIPRKTACLIGRPRTGDSAGRTTLGGGPFADSRKTCQALDQILIGRRRRMVTRPRPPCVHPSTCGQLLSHQRG